MFASLCILGRQPGLGLAELESLFGANLIQPVGDNAALLDITSSKVPFSRLGGTVKLCKVLEVLETTDWARICSSLEETVLQQIEDMPKGKIKLGLSLYGYDLPVKQISAAGLTIKKALKTAGRSARVTPNTAVALNSAQVLHNQLTGRLGMELVVVRENDRSFIAQTIAEQDIASYTLRDRGRPKRDARVGMLPPKLAQIITNLALGTVPCSPANEQSPLHRDHSRHSAVSGAPILTQRTARTSCSVSRPFLAEYPSTAPRNTSGSPVTRPKTGDKGQKTTKPLVLLDPFCGTGVILQEATISGFDTYGTDVDARMIEYTEANLQWLQKTYNLKPIAYNLIRGDATSYHWTEPFDAVATETYLGRPFTSSPDQKTLSATVNDCNTIIKKFLQNIAGQIKPGLRLCLAVPAWRIEDGFIHLPLLDSLTDMGYTRLSFVHADNKDLIYYREGQIVARELIVLKRT